MGRDSWLLKKQVSVVVMVRFDYRVPLVRHGHGIFFLLNLPTEVSVFVIVVVIVVVVDVSDDAIAL